MVESAKAVFGLISSLFLDTVVSNPSGGGGKIVTLFLILSGLIHSEKLKTIFPLTGGLSVPDSGVVLMIFGETVSTGPPVGRICCAQERYKQIEKNIAVYNNFILIR